MKKLLLATVSAVVLSTASSFGASTPTIYRTKCSPYTTETTLTDFRDCTGASFVTLSPEKSKKVQATFLADSKMSELQITWCNSFTLEALEKKQLTSLEILTAMAGHGHTDAITRKTILVNAIKNHKSLQSLTLSFYDIAFDQNDVSEILHQLPSLNKLSLKNYVSLDILPVLTAALLSDNKLSSVTVQLKPMDKTTLRPGHSAMLQPEDNIITPASSAENDVVLALAYAASRNPALEMLTISGLSEAVKPTVKTILGSRVTIN